MAASFFVPGLAVWLRWGCRSPCQGPPSWEPSVGVGGAEAASRLGPVGHPWGVLLPWAALTDFQVRTWVTVEEGTVGEEQTSSRLWGSLPSTTTGRAQEPAHSEAGASKPWPLGQIHK